MGAPSPKPTTEEAIQVIINNELATIRCLRSTNSGIKEVSAGAKNCDALYIRRLIKNIRTTDFDIIGIISKIKRPRITSVKTIIHLRSSLSTKTPAQGDTNTDGMPKAKRGRETPILEWV